MDNNQVIEVRAIPMVQPMGEFYVAVFSHSQLRDISYADIRELERDLDNYIGIQRKLSADRAKDISKFAHTVDATFPTSIVVAIPGECVEYEESRGILRIQPTDNYRLDGIAKILDGQHRIEGLRDYQGGSFDLSVTVFVEADIADQAYIFATVNLAQTKVNRSLVYDLLDYSKARSPQKTCHDIAVALDYYEDSPLYNMIKRLGTATPGRSGETISQAVFVGELLPMVTNDRVGDRDKLLRGKKLKKSDLSDLPKYPFRNLFIEEKDDDIAAIVMEFFRAVEHTWPKAWASREKGNMLPRTNGFRAFMRLMKDCYLHLVPRENIGQFVGQSDFQGILHRSRLKDSDFNTEEFLPGSTGENRLYKMLKEDCQV